jgi:hypothetical protein
LSVKLTIEPPVLKLLADSTADLDAQIRGDGHIAGIKQALDVSSKQEPVAGLMGTAAPVRADVSRLKGLLQVPST